MNRIVRSVLVCFAAMCGTTAVAQQPDPAEWAPSDALAFIGVSDTAELWESFKKSAGYRMMQDPAAEKVAAPTKKIIEGLKAKLAAMTGKSPDGLENPFKGPAALYITAAPGGGPDDVHFVAIVGVGDRDVMRTQFDAGIKKLREVASSYETDSVGSHEIHVFENTATANEDDNASPEDDPFGFQQDPMGAVAEQLLKGFTSGETMPEHLAVCLTDERLFVSDAAEAVKAALRRRDASDSLAASSDYRALKRHFKPLGQIRLVVNLPRLIDIARKADPGDSKLIAALGAKNVGTLIAHVAIGAKDYDQKIEALLLLDGERTGLAKLLSMKNRPVAPPASISDGTTLYASVSLDAMTVVDEIEKITRVSDPAAADAMRAGMESVPMPSGQMVNIRKDLLEHLTAPLTFGLRFDKPYSLETSHILMTLGHRSRAAIDRFLGLIGPPYLMARDLRGTQVFDGMMFGIAVAAGSDAVLIGNKQAVDDALQSSSAGRLADDREFKRAAKLAPQEAWLTVYADSRRLNDAIRTLLADPLALQGAMMAHPLAMILANAAMALESDPEAKAAVDATDKLSKYYAPMIITARTTSDGIRFEWVQLTPRDE